MSTKQRVGGLIPVFSIQHSDLRQNTDLTQTAPDCVCFEGQ